MKKKVVKFKLTEAQAKRVKNVLGVDCEICEIPVDDIGSAGGGIIDLVNPRKKYLRLNRDQIELLKEAHPRPPNSIIIDPNVAHKFYGVQPDTYEEEVHENLKKYLSDM